MMYLISCFFVAVALLLGILEYFFKVNLFEVGYTCIIHAITGFYCPACGGSHAFLYLIHGKLLLSIKSNPFVLYLAITGGSFFVTQTLMRISRGKIKALHFHVLFVYLGVFLLLLNCILKNIVQ